MLTLLHVVSSCSYTKLRLQCNVRDFDYYGAAYTILSAIATGGINAVVCDITARDEVRALLTTPCLIVHSHSAPTPLLSRASTMHFPLPLPTLLSLFLFIAVGLILHAIIALYYCVRNSSRRYCCFAALLCLISSRDVKIINDVHPLLCTAPCKWLC